MNHIQSIIQASENVLNEKTAAILFEVAKKNFITSGEIIEKLSSNEFKQQSVISNIGVLIKRGLIVKSDDGYCTTDNALEILEQSSEIYAEHNPTTEVAKTIEKANMRGKKRITGVMTDLSEILVSELQKHDIQPRPAFANRSNYEVFLEKRTLGVRSIEIRHKGLIRFCCYKISPELLQAFNDTGKILNNKVSKVVNYIDFELTEENVIDMIELFATVNNKI